MRGPVPPEAPDVTRLLLAWRGGDRGALDTLVPLVHAELRRLAHRQMRGERAGHPLQTTALVNEAYLRLVDSHRVQLAEPRPLLRDLRRIDAAGPR